MCFDLNEVAAYFVVLGGLIEFVSAANLRLGLLARLGGFVSLVYFLVVTVGFGGELSRGYACASTGGGGWDYVMLLMVVFAGAGCRGG